MDTSSFENFENDLATWAIANRKAIFAFFLLLVIAGMVFLWLQLHEAGLEAEIRLKTIEATTIQRQLEVARQFLGTKPAAPLLLQIASRQNENKDYAGAKKTYELFIEHYPHHPFFHAAELGRAIDLELLEQPDAALAAYLQIGRSHDPDVYAPIALLHAAGIYAQKKDLKNEQHVLSECQNEFRASLYGRLAAEKLKSLGQVNTAVAG